MIRILFLTCIALPAHAADYEFCWIGANGFVMEGRMTIPDTVRSQITENDVAAFTLHGTLNGVAIGNWDMANLTPDTSWNLNFDQTTSTFATGGLSGSDTGQQWNASGSVDNCGANGFGFNSGAGGQDVCVKNTYRTDSIIAADTPLPAYPLGEGPPCFSAPLLGLLALPPLTPAAWH